MSDDCYEYVNEFRKTPEEQEEEDNAFFNLIEFKVQGPPLTQAQVDSFFVKRDILENFKNFHPDTIEDLERLQALTFEKTEGLRLTMEAIGIGQSQKPVYYVRDDLYDRLAAIMDSHTNRDMKVLETTPISRSKAKRIESKELR